jgi:electron transport complex protein RnfE
MTQPAPTARDILQQGLWGNNTGLVQLLGLCPLLAVSTGAVNALGLGLATVLVLTLTNAAVSALRRFVREDVRIPVYVLIIAAVVTAIELAMNAWVHDLYRVLGLFIPLIATNCAVMGRAEVFAAKHDVGRAALDGFAIGTGFLVVLFLIGAIREIVGHGTLFGGAAALLGGWARPLELTLLPGYRGLLLAVLPTGAFIALALLIAAKQAYAARRQRMQSTQPATA